MANKKERVMADIFWWYLYYRFVCKMECIDSQNHEMFFFSDENDIGSFMGNFDGK